MTAMTDEQWYELKCKDVEEYCLQRYGSLEMARLGVTLERVPLHTPEKFCDFLETIRDLQENKPELFQ